MVLVAYSDSEGSDDEQVTESTKKPDPKESATPSTVTNYAIDKSNPRKIRVNLNGSASATKDGDDVEEPAPKRLRTNGSGVVSAFNAMLPAPKRNSEKKEQSNGTTKFSTRKVFSLRTGAEPAFSRDSDAELRQFFSEQDPTAEEDHTSGFPVSQSIPTPKTGESEVSSRPIQGNQFKFKPLSVARNTKKKKPSVPTSKPSTTAKSEEAKVQNTTDISVSELPAKTKINLFSAGNEDERIPDFSQPSNTEEERTPEDNMYGYDYDSINTTRTDSSVIQQNTLADTGPQSLDAIASDLNLSAADRRQLFGRNRAAGAAAAVNVVNFNTDQEYLANEALRASNGGDQQLNPVRAIAPGKHSLKQLVSSATGQKEALEESFASGRKNKKEAGNKYGW